MHRRRSGLWPDKGHTQPWEPQRQTNAKKPPRKIRNGLSALSWASRPPPSNLGPVFPARLLPPAGCPKNTPIWPVRHRMAAWLQGHGCACTRSGLGLLLCSSRASKQTADGPTRLPKLHPPTAVGSTKDSQVGSQPFQQRETLGWAGSSSSSPSPAPPMAGWRRRQATYSLPPRTQRSHYGYLVDSLPALPRFEHASFFPLCFSARPLHLSVHTWEPGFDLLILGRALGFTPHPPLPPSPCSPRSSPRG